MRSVPKTDAWKTNLKVAHYNYCESKGITTVRNVDENKIISLYKQGYGRDRIAHYTGYSRSIVYKKLKQLNLLRPVQKSHELAVANGLFKRQNCPNWKGGIHWKGGYKYVYAPDNGHTSDNYAPEHTLIWEKVHNKKLPHGWDIHHLNGIKSDNRPENLVALPKAKHSKRESGELYKKRIRELEAKVKLLEQSLERQQLICWTDN